MKSLIALILEDSSGNFESIWNWSDYDDNYWNMKCVPKDMRLKLIGMELDFFSFKLMSQIYHSELITVPRRQGIKKLYKGIINPLTQTPIDNHSRALKVVYHGSNIIY